MGCWENKIILTMALFIGPTILPILPKMLELISAKSTQVYALTWYHIIGLLEIGPSYFIEASYTIQYSETLHDFGNIKSSTFSLAVISIKWFYFICRYLDCVDFKVIHLSVPMEPVFHCVPEMCKLQFVIPCLSSCSVSLDKILILVP